MSAIDCAARLCADLLARAGAPRSTYATPGDPLRVWADSVWSAVRHEPGRPLDAPPAAAGPLTERVADMIRAMSRGEACTGLALTLALAAWVSLRDATSSVARDPEGDGTDAEHDGAAPARSRPRRARAARRDAPARGGAVVSAEERDRVVARRVLRRHVGARDNARIEPTEERFAWRTFELARSIHRGAQILHVVDHVLDAAVEGARLGREYAAALRSAS